MRSFVHEGVSKGLPEASREKWLRSDGGSGGGVDGHRGLRTSREGPQGLLTLMLKAEEQGRTRGPFQLPHMARIGPIPQNRDTVEAARKKGGLRLPNAFRATPNTVSESLGARNHPRRQVGSGGKGGTICPWITTMWGCPPGIFMASYTLPGRKAYPFCASFLFYCYPFLIRIYSERLGQ